MKIIKDVKKRNIKYKYLLREFIKNKKNPSYRPLQNTRKHPNQ